jgi:uncharacterized protein
MFFCLFLHMKKKILLAGGTGLIGTRLQAILKSAGYDLHLLTRKPQAAHHFAWDPEKGYIDERAFEGVSAVINLAGAGIADKRWTTQRKKELVQSRVQSVQVLHDYFQRSGFRPECYINASAIGIYGDSGERWMAETDQASDAGFMIDCCLQWENAARTIESLGIRTVVLRIGVVLAKEGGALAEIAKPLQFGIAAYFADGSIWYSWIHRDDVCGMIRFAIENEQIRGVYNAVAPAPERIKVLVQKTAVAMGKTVLLVPAPSFALRLVLGEMSAVVLNSNRVTPQKIVDAGFVFQYPTAEGALGEIYG